MEEGQPGPGSLYRKCWQRAVEEALMKSRRLDLLTGRRRIALLVAGLLVLAIPLAAAAVSVRLISGATTVTCDDGDPCDVNPAAGAVTVIGTVGLFTVNVTTAITEPALGSASFAILDLNP
jgi:hypothetical protein